MWRIYDELIDCVPAGLAVEECVAGLHWTLVRSVGTGVAMTPTVERHVSATDAGRLAGMPVRELAARIKSWNPLDAALGLAAVNSVVNAQEELERRFAPPPPADEDVSIFEALRGELRGRRVGVVGHFRGIESLHEVCDLTILELTPQDGDLPAPACEYLLPAMDYVFLTATTLLNKTLPRLLELSRGARVAVTGPSTPMSPVLLGHGVQWLAGQVVCDAAAVFGRICEGGSHDFAEGETRMRIYSSREVRAGTGAGA